jgi:glycosyltransferase involved in cell wall biosynthesis
VVAVHQVLPVFAPRDAIGNHTAAVRRCLRAAGIGGQIFAGEVVPGAPDDARTVRHARPGRLAAAEPTLWLYHASTGSPVAEWFAELPGAKAIDYHNITPAEALEPWEPHIGVELRHGRRQLAELAGAAGWALADSAYNATELSGLGYPWTAVVPILLDPAQFAAVAPDPGILAGLRARKAAEGGADWLFVSRLLPHKGQHDLVKALAAYRLAFDPAARLTLIGAAGSTRYAGALADFVADLGLRDAVTVSGSVPPTHLAAHFQVADVYVSASAHEGFGVPLVEAMAHDVPVVAYAATAVPETLDGAGVLVADRDPETLAAAVHRVVTDAGLQRALVGRGHRRLTELALPVSEQKLRRAVSEVLAAAGLASG